MLTCVYQSMNMYPINTIQSAYCSCRLLKLFYALPTSPDTFLQTIFGEIPISTSRTRNDRRNHHETHRLYNIGTSTSAVWVVVLVLKKSFSIKKSPIYRQPNRHVQPALNRPALESQKTTESRKEPGNTWKNKENQIKYAFQRISRKLILLFRPFLYQTPYILLHV